MEDVELDTTPLLLTITITILLFATTQLLTITTITNGIREDGRPRLGISTAITTTCMSDIQYAVDAKECTDMFQ